MGLDLDQIASTVHTADALAHRVRELEQEIRGLRMQLERMQGALRRAADDLERMTKELDVEVEVRALALRRTAEWAQEPLL